MKKNSHRLNWYTAMGILFILMASIVIIRNVFIWGPGFVADFFISNEITNEKISTGMIGFGCFLLYLGFKKRRYEKD